MIQISVWLILCGALLLFILVDVLGHKFLKVSRTIGQNLAQDLTEQAAQVENNRAINYLLAKKPLLGEGTGLLDLQIAKLYLAVDDRDTAREYIHQVVGSSGSIRQDSPIKEPLLEAVNAETPPGVTENSASSPSSTCWMSSVSSPSFTGSPEIR